MKSFRYLMAAALLFLMLIPLQTVSAQTSKAKLPQVPITYPSDANETIAKRAQWVEGANDRYALNMAAFRLPRLLRQPHLARPRIKYGAGFETAMENLARYIIRASFSQERMQYLDQEGKVVYT